MSRTAREWTATATCAVAAAWLAYQLSGQLQPLVVLAIGGVILCAGAAVTVTSQRHAGLTIAAGGAAIAAYAVPGAAASTPEMSAWWATIAVLLLLAAGSAGDWLGAAVLGAAALVLFGALWEVVVLTGWLAGGAALIGALSVLSLGLLARRAAAIAGLTRFGVPIRGGADVAAAIVAAHRQLMPALAVVVGSTALAGTVLAGRAGIWPLAMAGLLAVIVLLRARAHPVGVEAISMLIAGGLIVVFLVQRWTADNPAVWPIGVIIAAVVASVAVAWVAYQPGSRLTDRARRIADGAEITALVALLPVGAGAIGAYSLLF